MTSTPAGRPIAMSLRGHTATPAAATRPAAGRRHVVFTLADIEYGIDARQVRRSMPAPSTLGPEVVFLGQAYPVMDLRVLFGHPPGTTPGRLILLVEGGSGRAGLVVDALVDLLLIESAALAPLPEIFAGAERQWLEGLARLGSRVVVVLRLDGILGSHAVLPPALSRGAASGFGA